MPTMKCIWILAILAATGVRAPAAKEVDSAPAGKPYLQEILAAYASYSSYHDNGNVEIIYYEAGKKVDERQKKFATRYIKDGPFEITWKTLSKGGGEIEYRIQGKWGQENGVRLDFFRSTVFKTLCQLSHHQRLM